MRFFQQEDLRITQQVKAILAQAKAKDDMDTCGNLWELHR